MGKKHTAMTSRTRRAPKRAAVSPAIRSGLEALVEGNENLIAQMLSISETGGNHICDELEKVMGVNSISAEQLLARFFDSSMLSSYCEKKLGKSGKGTESTLASRIVAAWSKPAPKAKRKKEAPVVEDWRATLFVWRGALNRAEDKVTWKGSWVGATTATVSDLTAEDFNESENQFELSANLVLTDDASDTPDGLVGGMRGELTGWYLLDNGDGHGRHSDLQHSFQIYNVAASSETPGAEVCVAVGDTEFGRFVSLGSVTGAAESKTLTLCRRYVEDADRAQLESPTQFVDRLKVTQLRDVASTPWKLL